MMALDRNFVSLVNLSGCQWKRHERTVPQATMTLLIWSSLKEISTSIHTLTSWTHVWGPATPICVPATQCSLPQSNGSGYMVRKQWYTRRPTWDAISSAVSWCKSHPKHLESDEKRRRRCQTNHTWRTESSNIQNSSSENQSTVFVYAHDQSSQHNKIMWLPY